MRVDQRRRSWLGLVLLGGGLLSCSIRLDSDPPAVSEEPPPRALGGCVPLGGAATQVSGALVSLALPDGAVAVLASSATVGGETGLFAFRSPEPASVASFGPCLTAATVLPARPVVDPPALNPAARAQPLGAATDPQGDSYLFFESVHADGFASDGLGVARWDATLGRFTHPTLLWTADRPRYGSGVGLDGASLYVVGGRGGGFLSADMFVARAPLAGVATPGAYEYAQGGGTWSADPDAAAAFARGGTAPSLAYHPSHARWLLAYVTPYSTEVTVRSGLSPSGPWSLPVTLGRCTLPAGDKGGFCTDVVLHPLLSSIALGDASPPGADDIVLSYSPVAGDAPATSDPTAYQVHLGRAPWPAALP